MIYNKWNPPRIPPSASFEGQSVLITGATGGLGLEAAIHYVQLGAAKVYITSRKASRGEEARASIEARTGKNGVVHVCELEMDTFAGVKTFVDSLAAEIKEIDIVLLNAGLLQTRFEASPDGWEKTLQVNVLSTTLLALLLLPWMKEARPSSGGPQHLGLVSSGLHTTIDIISDEFPKKGVLEYFNDEKHFAGQKYYAISKLFLMYAAAEIAKFAGGPPGSPSVIVNTICPGVCKSDLGRGFAKQGLMYQVAISIFSNLIAKTPEAGARTYVLAAMTTPEENGKYIRHYSTPEEYAERSSKVLTNPEGQKMQAEVWREILEVLESKVPGFMKNAHDS